MIFYFWSLYILATLFIAFFISYFFENNRWIVFVVVTLLLITPAKTDINSGKLSPSIFTFFYDLILEGKFSTITLRPLVISSIVLITYFIVFFFIKRKFFQKKGH